MMIDTFIYQSPSIRVRCGAGTLRHLAEEIDVIAGTRALILSTSFQKDDADALAARIGADLN